MDYNRSSTPYDVASSNNGFISIAAAAQSSSSSSSLHQQQLDSMNHNSGGGGLFVSFSENHSSNSNPTTTTTGAAKLSMPMCFAQPQPQQQPQQQYPQPQQHQHPYVQMLNSQSMSSSVTAYPSNQQQQQQQQHHNTSATNPIGGSVSAAVQSSTQQASGQQVLHNSNNNGGGMLFHHHLLQHQQQQQPMNASSYFHPVSNVNSSSSSSSFQMPLEMNATPPSSSGAPNPQLLHQQPFLVMLPDGSIAEQPIQFPHHHYGVPSTAAGSSLHSMPQFAMISQPSHFQFNQQQLLQHQPLPFHQQQQHIQQTQNHTTNLGVSVAHQGQFLSNVPQQMTPTSSASAIATPPAPSMQQQQQQQQSLPAAVINQSAATGAHPGIHESNGPMIIGGRLRHGGNAHTELKNACKYFAYRDADQIKASYPQHQQGSKDQLLPLFVQMFPSEHKDQAASIFEKVLTLICGPGAGSVVGVEPRSDTSFIVFVRTGVVWHVIYNMRYRVLMDRHGFWYAENLMQYAMMREYCENVRTLPQQARHAKTDGMPSMPLVIELSRTMSRTSITAPPAPAPFDIQVSTNTTTTATASTTGHGGTTVSSLGGMGQAAAWAK
jgi:hypothetical protein